MKFRLIVCTFLLALGSGGVSATELGDVAFRQALLDVETDLRLMCVAAHPDDEDGATLSYYRMLHGIETHAVIATRGEGGQNEKGPELYNALGVIRTREMRAAAAIEGAQLHFLNLPEFGYSKTAEETLEIWGEQVALERMVRVIRETRPHVIITNHGRLKDHGHHQAIGAILQRAFDVAGDPSQFPIHRSQGLEPWQPLRLYIRDFKGSEGAVANDIATLEPIRGKTIAEIAASALEVHESQGMRFFIDLLLSTQPRSFYQLVLNKRVGDVTAKLTGRGPLFEGLPWVEDENRPQLDSRTVSREAAKPVLLSWLAANEDMRTGSFDERARWAAVNRAAIQAVELRLTTSLSDSVATPGQDVSISASLIDFGEQDSIVADMELTHHHGLNALGRQKVEAPLHRTGTAQGEFKVAITADADLTLPHAPRLFDAHFLEPQLSIDAEVICGNALLHLTAPVYLDVAAPLTIACPDAPLLVRPANAGAFPVRLLVTNNTPDALAEFLSLVVPDGWQVTPKRQSLSLAREGEQRFATFSVTPPEGVAPGDYPLAAQVVGATTSTEIALRVVDVAVPEAIRVGVIQSYDDTFVTTLEKLGVPHETLQIEDYVEERLDAFTAIIVDIRAYQYRPDLVANNASLLDYVARGGTLLVMYQKTFDWNDSYAPYPITLSRNRVTREDAPITMLEPAHRLFTTPNQIGAGDWSGWLQERGLYFPVTWSAEYTPLIATADPGEELPPGSYLVATHGKGQYVYTALGWYRQLRMLHPGALRCFANMLTPAP